MIILQFDAVYYEWGLLLVRSLALHEPAKKLFADTVNLDADQLARLKRAHPRILVTREAMTLAGTGSNREAMARRKTMVLQRAIDTFPDEPWFGLLDADMLVRRPLTDLWALLDHHPAALFMTDGVWRGRASADGFTPSGIVLIRRDGRELVDQWVQWGRRQPALSAHRPGEWFWDQRALLDVMEKSRVNCAAIPFYRFSCNRCLGEAAIWSGHGTDGVGNYRFFVIEHEVQQVLHRHPLLRRPLDASR